MPDFTQNGPTFSSFRSINDISLEDKFIRKFSDQADINLGFIAITVNVLTCHFKLFLTLSLSLNHFGKSFSYQNVQIKMVLLAVCPFSKWLLDIVDSFVDEMFAKFCSN